MKKIFGFFVREEDAGFALYFLLAVIAILVLSLIHPSNFVWFGVTIGLLLCYAFLFGAIHHFKETHV
jgi:cell division protein FtsW (lipid II flippase)